MFIKTVILGVLGLTVSVSSGFSPRIAPAPMKQQRPPGLYLDLVSSNLSSWEPRGHYAGISNLPSDDYWDLILTVQLTREGPPPPGIPDERIYYFFTTVYSSYNPGQYTNDPATETDPPSPIPGIPTPLDAT